jgi:hypothetical protein
MVNLDYSWLGGLLGHLHQPAEAFIPVPDRRDVFRAIQKLAHAAIRATGRLITALVVWNGKRRPSGCGNGRKSGSPGLCLDSS